MAEQALQSASGTAGTALLVVTLALLGTTVALLLLRRSVPAVGDPLWRGYRRLLRWLAVQPVRLIRLLVREALGRPRQ